jgi:hypothetical protein
MLQQKIAIFFDHTIISGISGAVSELSAKIEELRGRMSISDFIRKASVSRETYRKIQIGKPVKLSTIQQVSKAFNLNKAHWHDIMVAWLKTEIGPDEAQHLWIERKAGSKLQEGKPDESARVMMLFSGLTHNERQEIIKAMERKEVRNCLPAINRSWEQLTQPRRA